jgi:hypothetical protein
VAVALVGCTGCEWLSRVGAVPEPTEAEFAARLIAVLPQDDAGRPARYDAEHQVVTGEHATIATPNLYREWLATPPAERPAMLRRLAAVSAGARRHAGLEAAEARTRLLPVVRAGLYFGGPGLALRDAGLEQQPWQRRLGEASALGLVIDLPQAMQLARQQDLVDWKLSGDEALAVAVENLRRQAVPFVEVAPGVYGPRSGDNYDASRLLLTQEIRALPLGAPVVAMIPNRDTLLLASGRDEQGQARLADLAEKAAQEPRPIHTIPLCLGEGGWAECVPDLTPALKARFHALAEGGWRDLYAEQQPRLQELVGQEVFVARLRVATPPGGAGVVSFASWTRTVPTLLPRADMVVLSEPGAKAPLGWVPWSRLLEVCGSHLEPDGRSPPRWATGDWFPGPAELERLSLAPLGSLRAP